MNKAYPKFQYSVFLKNGRDEQLVIRADDFEELAEAKKDIDKIMGKREEKPVQTSIPANKPDYAKKQMQETCPHTTFKVYQVKKEGPNQGKWFKTCATCSKFIAWVEQPTSMEVAA